MKKLISLILFINIHAITANGPCTVKSESTLVLSENSRMRDLKQLFQFTDCGPKHTDHFLKYITDYRGDLTARQFSLQTGVEDIRVLNDITIISMDEFLQKELKLKSPLVIYNSNIVGEKIKSFSLEEFDDIQAICEKCKEMGPHTYKVSIQKTDGVTRNLWVKSETVTQVKVLTPINSIIVNNNALHAKHFTWQTIYTSEPNDYFTDLKELAFYKLTRNVKKNSPLKRNALTHVKLVKAGQITSMVMNHEGLSLKSKGISTRNGNIGDVVTLRNIKTKKIIMGKVIGENLVEVKL